MKHNLKRILPILLAILVIGSIVWYVFVYDRDFTRDMLVKQARFFEQQGNQSVAAWLYDQAYIYSGSDDKVAIELAEQFVSIGDYTKAERTLSKAIADGGAVDLYIALCKVYVQQDKLKDAVAMLDNVTKPDIKAQLDSLRPSAPTVSPPPGFYSQYIPVTVSAEGTLYLTTDLSYPSTKNPCENATVNLVGGENTLRAICVNEKGLVSPLVHFGYTVQGVIEEVSISDESMNKQIREQLKVGADAVLYTDDLWTITSFVMPKAAKSSADLAYLTSLKTLSVEGSTINGWSSLSSLRELTELSFKNCSISTQDLLVISSLPKLEKLTLTGCNLSSIENLSSAKQLTWLNLSNNTIRDLKPLSFVSGLKHLDLSRNAVENVTALSALGKLETLDISNNSLKSVLPLTSCTQLKQLKINHNTVASLSGLDALKNLTKLEASYNALTDASSLSGCTALVELDISNNSLTSIGSLSSLNKLEYFNFSRNKIGALPAWSKDCALVTIDGSNNKITSVSSLAGYHNLNNVLMDNNKISSVNSLTSCHHLITVSVYGNPVSDVSALKEMSVIVYYTP